jgi:hypothetical protein
VSPLLRKTNSRSQSDWISPIAPLVSVAANFVALAEIHQLPLMTVDRQILHEFPEVAIFLQRFVRD